MIYELKVKEEVYDWDEAQQCLLTKQKACLPVVTFDRARVQQMRKTNEPMCHNNMYFVSVWIFFAYNI